MSTAGGLDVIGTSRAFIACHALTSEGMSAAQIGARLGVSVRTVRRWRAIARRHQLANTTSTPAARTGCAGEGALAGASALVAGTGVSRAASAPGPRTQLTTQARGTSEEVRA